MAIKHLHILIRAECKNSPKSSDEALVEKKVSQLIKDIGMNVFMAPKAKYMPDIGNSGLTFVAGLETSHTSAHFFDEASDDIMNYPGSTLLQADLYTCGCLSLKQIKTILKFYEEYDILHLNAVVFNRAKSLIRPDNTLEFDISDGKNFTDFIESLDF